MSKKYTKKEMSSNVVTSDRYLFEVEEGEYITKKIRTNEIKGIYIYSTTADVTVMPSSEKNITVTLFGVRGDVQYFDVFRLDEYTLYIIATSDNDSIVQSKLDVFLPESQKYNIQVVTNYGCARIEEGISVKKMKLEVGKGIVPKSKKN